MFFPYSSPPIALPNHLPLSIYPSLNTFSKNIQEPNKKAKPLKHQPPPQNNNKINKTVTK